MTIDLLLLQRVIYAIIAVVGVWCAWTWWRAAPEPEGRQIGGLIFAGLLLWVLLLGRAWAAVGALDEASTLGEALGGIVWAGAWLWATLYLTLRLRRSEPPSGRP